MKINSTNFFVHVAWFFYFRAAAAVISLACLMSCGGQGSAMGPDLGTLPDPKVVITDQTVVPPSPTVLQGAYQGNFEGNEFVSFVTPATDSSDAKLFVLYFLATSQNVDILPAILSGSVTLGMDGAASIASLKMFTNSTPQLYSGSGTFSAASSGGYKLEGLSTADGQKPTFNASALATSANLSGTWTGTWADSAANLTRKYSNITFDTAERPTAWDFLSYCQAGSTLTLTPASYTQLSSTGKFYQAKLSIPQITLCGRTKTASVELTGVAFIHVLPNTVKRRLELVLVDSTGSGISFRGDQ